MPDIKTVSELKALYAAAEPDGHFFDRSTLAFFGASDGRVYTSEIGGKRIVVYSEWQEGPHWFSATVFLPDGTCTERSGHHESRVDAIGAAIRSWVKATEAENPTWSRASSRWAGEPFAVRWTPTGWEIYEVIGWTTRTLSIRSWPPNPDEPEERMLRLNKVGYQVARGAHPLRFTEEPTP